MEKRLSNKVEEYIQSFKQKLHNQILNTELNDREDKSKLCEYVFEYPKLCLEKEDFVKRKRVKNSIPEVNRCIARRANGEQCTRRRKEESDYCGTHYKGAPHGTIGSEKEDINHSQSIEVFVEHVNGICYYMDKYQNVFNTEDILNNVDNPRVIGKWEIKNNKYYIPNLGLV